MLFVLNNACCQLNKKPQQNGTKDTSHYINKIDSLIKSEQPRKFNGVVLITQYGQVKYSKAVGYSNFAKKTPISLTDNFRIQSNSKQIAAVIVLKEVEKGNIDLNSPIKKYLPQLKQTWADSVTVHQLLNMSSGISAIDKPLLFEPGTSFHYSNPAYTLLGKIVENVTGNSFSKTTNQLFKELGMDNSYCYQFNGDNKGLINGHNHSDTQFHVVNFDSFGFTQESWKDFIPAGGIISNALDLYTWDSKLHKGKILNDKTYQLMINSEVVDFHQAFSEDDILYGYGINIHKKFSPIYYGHAGTGLGFASLKIYVPEKDLSFIILENVFNSDMNVNYHFEKEIRKIIMTSNLAK